jgi:chorismate dehydratase
MNKTRLGAVGYLNARPLVFGLERSSRFDLRFDVPSRCAALLHQRTIDVGLIPSIEYLHNHREPTEAGRNAQQAVAGTGGIDRYRIVPDVAISSRGPVASVLLHSTRPIADVRSIALDTSSRTSVALLRVLCARHFMIEPAFEPHGPDLAQMLSRCDAALIIGDRALFPGFEGSATRDLASVETHGLGSSANSPQSRLATVTPKTRVAEEGGVVETVDLGAIWTETTGLPFVYAFWVGREGALDPDGVHELQSARNAGIVHPREIAREYVGDVPGRLEVGEQYLRDNIRYHLGADERAGLELFYRYAAEDGVVPSGERLLFYEA